MKKYANLGQLRYVFIGMIALDLTTYVSIMFDEKVRQLRSITVCIYWNDSFRPYNLCVHHV